MKEKDLKSPTGLMTTPSTSTPHTKQTDQICLGSRPQKRVRLDGSKTMIFFSTIFMEKISAVFSKAEIN